LRSKLRFSPALAAAPPGAAASVAVRSISVLIYNDSVLS